MKRILSLIGILVLLLSTGSYAQTNQFSNPAAVGIDGVDIMKGKSGVINAIVENNGSDPMPAGTFRVYINIDQGKMSFVDASTYITANYPDWAVFAVSATQLTLVNANGEISPSEVVSFDIQVNALASATVGPANVNLRVGITPGRTSQAGNADNSAADDNAPGIVNIIIDPLPVTLVSFTASKEASVTLLKWATTMETNSDYFEIQHSVTGKEWAKIDRVASHGESSSLKSYSYQHAEPVNGENLYRLKMVDKDATYAYSRIQSVTFEGLSGADLSVYPNPVTDKLIIRDFSQVTQIRINDVNGRSVYQAQGAALGEVNVKNLSTGIYVVNITRSNGIKSSQKIVISK